MSIALNLSLTDEQKLGQPSYSGGRYVDLVTRPQVHCTKVRKKCAIGKFQRRTNGAKFCAVIDFCLSQKPMAQSCAIDFC
jgi:hypothetical protein